MPVRRQRMSYSRKAKRGKTPTRKLTKRKTPTKKRKTTKKKTTKAVDPNLAAYVNPFSNLTSQPKIPDGKPSESVGLTFRDVTQVVQSDPANPVMFALVPALGYCCIIQNDQLSAGLAGNFNSAKTNCRQFTDAPGSFDISSSNAGPVDDGTTIDHDTADVAHWRLVSAGLRISLLNAAEQDDGWWESTTFVIDDQSNFWGIVPRLTDSTENALFQPIGQIYNNRNADFSNTRGYQTGLLRDLHKHVFRTKPCMEDHDFHDLRGGFRFDAGEASLLDSNFLQFQEGSQTFRHMSKELVDNSFQITLIRCYGRGQDPPSRFHVDSQANYEFIYSREANESKFHTGAAMHEDFKDVTTGLRRDPTPGVVMSM